MALAFAAADLGLHHRRILGELGKTKLKRCHLFAEAAFGQLDRLNQLLQLLVAQPGELLGRGQREFGGLGRRLAVGHGASLHKTTPTDASQGEEKRRQIWSGSSGAARLPG